MFLTLTLSTSPHSSWKKSKTARGLCCKCFTTTGLSLYPQSCSNFAMKRIKCNGMRAKIRPVLHFIENNLLKKKIGKKKHCMCRCPQAPCVHHVNVRGGQCHHNYVGHQRWDYNICGHGQAKCDLAC